MTKIEKNIVPHAIKSFEKELNAIQDDSLKAFFYNALAVAPQSFHDDEVLQKFNTKVFHILRGILHQRDVQGAARDALLGTVLICDIMFNEFDEDMRAVAPAAVRTYLENRGLMADINRPLWENIMRAIESHMGDKGASPLLEARPGTAEYEIFLAFSIGRLDYIKLDWEMIYNEEGKTE